jgi:hypothetical protein
MQYKKLVSALVGVVACAAMTATDASAQYRGGGRFHGGRAIAAPRVVAARTFGPRTRGFYPYRSYHPYRSYYHPYRWYRPGFSVGLYRGFGYPYRYGYYAYPYNVYYGPYSSGYYYRYPRSVFRGYVDDVDHGRVWTDTTDDASTATTTSDR